MAPSKRKQTADAAGPKAKAPRAAAKLVALEEMEAPVIEVPPEHKPVLELLDQAMELDALTAASRAMFQAALPTVFLKPPEERHPFEKKVLELFDCVFSSAEAKLTGKVAEAQANLDEVATSKEAAAHLREELTGKIKSKQDEAEATSTDLQTTIGSVDVLQKALDDELVKEKDSAESCKTCESDKERFDAVIKELQTLIKAEGMDAKAWRARNKEIDRFMETFQELPVDKSLCDGLHAGLKSKPIIRGKFTTAVVEYSQKALEDHLLALDTKLSSCRTVSSDIEAVVAEARSKLEVAIKEKDDLEKMLQFKMNEAAELQQQQHEADATIEASGTKSSIRAEELSTLRARLDSFCRLQLSYGQLRDGPAPAAAAPLAVESTFEEGQIDKMSVDAVAIAAH
mmetsp:Transcript_42915/g.98506  ORF Transcript_42915/g.98506 Transcript_42915/m.98506 type:complete len:400 (-) Transcript_42915:146-1345(-)